MSERSREWWVNIGHIRLNIDHAGSFVLEENEVLEVQYLQCDQKTEVQLMFPRTYEEEEESPSKSQLLVQSE